MSFRNTYITNFIYHANAQGIESHKRIKEILLTHGSVDCAVENGIGYYCGIIKTLSGTLAELTPDLENLVYEIEKVTALPFTLTVMVETPEAVLTFEIEPIND